ncbi:MAG: efflux RND transporter periplasmic adaptor subunit [Vulcanimicrobiaceae bacterium]
MRHRTAIIGVIGAFIVIAIVVLMTTRHRQAAVVPDAQPQVALAPAREATFVETVKATGRIGAPAGTEAKLAFAVPGILRSVFVRVGERVTAGEPLAQLDTTGLSLAASQAQADAQAAAANARQARVDRTSTKIAVDEAALRREESLYAAGVAARKVVEAAQAQLASDRADASVARATVNGAAAQVQSAQAKAALASRDYTNGTLRAPSDGVIVGILKQRGESVDTTMPVIAIGPGSTDSLTLQVFSSDATRVHVGDPVTVLIVGTQMHGTGRVVNVVPSVDPSTQSATVVVSGVPTGATAGSAVQATIAVARDRGIVVPQSAIVQDPQSGQTLVFVQTRQKNGDAKFEQRGVQVAQSDGTRALIASGLRAGEQVAAQGAFALLAPAGGGD